MNTEIIVTIAVQLISFGIFIGMMKSSLNDIKIRLQRIEDKEDKQNEQIAELRERTAILESQIETILPLFKNKS